MPVTVARGLNTGPIESDFDIPNFDLANGLTVMASLVTDDSGSLPRQALQQRSHRYGVDPQDGCRANELMVATDGTKRPYPSDGDIYHASRTRAINGSSSTIASSASAIDQNLEIESNRLYACWDDQIRVFEKQSGLWQETISKQAPSPIKELHASTDDMIIVTETAIWAYSYPFAADGDFVHVFGTGEGLQAAIDGDTLVVAEAAGYVYGFYNTFLPGQVFIYERSGSSWIQSQTLVALDTRPDDYRYGRLHRQRLDTGRCAGHDNQGIDTGAPVYRSLNSNWKPARSARRALAEMSFGTRVITDGFDLLGWIRLADGTAAVFQPCTTTLPEFEWMNQMAARSTTDNWHPFTPGGNSVASMSIPATMPIWRMGSSP